MIKALQFQYAFLCVFAVSVVCNYSCGISRQLVVIAQMEGFIYISGLKKSVPHSGLNVKKNSHICKCSLSVDKQC